MTASLGLADQLQLTTVSIEGTPIVRSCCCKTTSSSGGVGPAGKIRASLEPLNEGLRQLYNDEPGPHINHQSTLEYYKLCISAR